MEDIRNSFEFFDAKVAVVAVYRVRTVEDMDVDDKPTGMYSRRVRTGKIAKTAG
jgi:hypothetical protein